MTSVAVPQTESPVSPAMQVATAAPVCHLSMSLATGGLERLLVDFSRYGDASRFPLRFVALQELGRPAEEIRENGFAVDSLRFGEIGKGSLVRNLARLLRQERVQVLHTHNTYPHFYGTIAARLAGVPVVVNTQHGFRNGISWKHCMQSPLANRWTQRIVAVSEDSATLCRRIDPQAADRITCIWNGIDLSRFAYHGPCMESDRITAIAVARLSREKDFPTLLRAVSQVVREVPTFRLLMIGDGSERHTLETLTDELQLREHVEFLGERSDVPQWLARATFFVCSSLIEGISLTLLEASAVGLPIVATNIGGNPEIVDDGRTGSLVPPGDANSLATAIVAMCRDQVRWHEMGRRGRERVEEHFEIRRMIRSYETLYTELLDSSR